MKTFIEVEILGTEVSVYGGIDGHYVGTEVVGYNRGNLFDLLPEATVLLQDSRISVKTDNKIVVEPNTHNFGIKVTFDSYDVAKAIMGCRPGSNFERYCQISHELQYTGIKVKELKTLLEA